MLMMKQLVCLFFFLLLILSCREVSPIRELKKGDSVSDFADTLFLGKVENLYAYKNKLYFIEQFRNQIVVLDDNLRLTGLVGIEGEGPTNLCGISGFVIHDDTLCAIDPVCGKILLFSMDGRVVGRRQFVGNEPLMPEFRFVASKGNLIEMSVSDKQGAFGRLDILSDSISFWGQRTLYPFDDLERIRNGRHLFKYKSHYICISDNEPVIEFYDAVRKRKGCLDYTSLDVVQRRLNYLRSHSSSSAANSYGIICEDAYVDENDNLLILLLSSNGDKGYEVNTLAVFDLQHDGARLREVCKLSGSVYSSFCYMDGSVYAFNVEQSVLEQFFL